MTTCVYVRSPILLSTEFYGWLLTIYSLISLIILNFDKVQVYRLTGPCWAKGQFKPEELGPVFGDQMLEVDVSIYLVLSQIPIL